MCDKNQKRVEPKRKTNGQTEEMNRLNRIHAFLKNQKSKFKLL